MQSSLVGTGIKSFPNCIDIHPLVHVLVKRMRSCIPGPVHDANELVCWPSNWIPGPSRRIFEQGADLVGSSGDLEVASVVAVQRVEAAKGAEIPPAQRDEDEDDEVGAASKLSIYQWPGVNQTDDGRLRTPSS